MDDYVRDGDQGAAAEGKADPEHARMYCMRCGTQAPSADAAFCASCGTPHPRAKTSCEAPEPVTRPPLGTAQPQTPATKTEPPDGPPWQNRRSLRWAALAVVVAALSIAGAMGMKTIQANQAYQQTSARARELLGQVGCPPGSDPSTSRRDDEVRGSADVMCFEPGTMGGHWTSFFIAPSSVGWQGFYDATLEKNQFGLDKTFQCLPSEGLYNLVLDYGLNVIHGEDWIITTRDAATAQRALAAGGETICSVPQQ